MPLQQLLFHLSAALNTLKRQRTTLDSCTDNIYTFESDYIFEKPGPVDVAPLIIGIPLKAERRAPQRGRAGAGAGAGAGALTGKTGRRACVCVHARAQARRSMLY